MALSALLEEGRRRLEQSALREGGWGYHPGGEVFVEPTALGLLALAPREPASGTSADAAPIAGSLRVLLSCQHPEGSFGTAREDPEASWATAPALLALAAHGRADLATAAGRFLAAWQVPEKPPTQAERDEVRRLVRIDLALRGWPWQAGEAFGTVEPTSLACIALRAWGDATGRPRIAEGVRYLADRAGADGGWNYGNPYFYDDPLPAVTLPSVKALLAVALCGGESERPLLTRARAAVVRLLAENPSRKAHAWGAIALAAAGDGALAARHAEAAVDSGDGFGAWFGGPDVIALAVLAVRAASDDAPACLAPVRT